MPFEAKNVVGDFAALREMFALSQSRKTPVIVVGADVLVGFDRHLLEELLRAHGLVSD